MKELNNTLNTVHENNLEEIKNLEIKRKVNDTLDFNLRVTDTITPKKLCASCNKDITGVSVPDDNKSYHVMCWTKLGEHKENADT